MSPRERRVSAAQIKRYADECTFCAFNRTTEQPQSRYLVACIEHCDRSHPDVARFFAESLVV